MLRQLCGDETLRNVLIVTNMWNQVPQAKGVAREEELKSDEELFKPVMDKGAAMLRHDNTLESARTIVRHLARKAPRTLRIQKELVDQKKSINDTAAGVELQGELHSLMERHRLEIRNLRDEMTRAIADRDLTTRNELDQARRELENKLHTLEGEKERLSREYQQEKQQADERIRQLIQAHQEERRRREEKEAELEGMRRAAWRPPKKENIFGRIARVFAVKRR